MRYEARRNRPGRGLQVISSAGVQGSSAARQLRPVGRRFGRVGGCDDEGRRPGDRSRPQRFVQPAAFTSKVTRRSGPRRSLRHGCACICGSRAILARQSAAEPDSHYRREGAFMDTNRKHFARSAFTGLGVLATCVALIAAPLSSAQAPAASGTAAQAPSACRARKARRSHRALSRRPRGDHPARVDQSAAIGAGGPLSREAQDRIPSCRLTKTGMTR